ncbi:MAG: 4Fe-4S binding protein [Promethearchaeota archaeon]
MKAEKLFPISINPNLCVRCQRCMYSCSPKAIFFKNSMRYVNYEKCEGCLKCVDVCEHGAIEVISIEEGKLEGFTIDEERCLKCYKCLKDDFCFQGLFFLERDEKGQEYVKFRAKSLSKCFKCLKCFKNCPGNAIFPIIKE